ncbi:MAG: Hpt domain-containing protein [Prolixibacteraceae bacterium]
MAYSNLDYLRAITEGDQQIIREMIQIFLDQIPVFSHNLNELYLTGQYAALGSEAHKIKSSLLIMGMNELAEEMKDLQNKTIQKIDPESYPVYISHFETQCKAVIEELQIELASL